jgi:transcriptional regulator with XRE-family HTH domain
MGKAQGRQGRKPAPPRPTLHQLRAWREYRGLSQEELGEAAGIGHGTVSRYENGRISLTESPLRRLAAALRLAPWQIYVSPSDDSAALCARIAKLSPEHRRAVMAVIEAFEPRPLQTEAAGGEPPATTATTTSKGRARRRRTSA